MTPARDERFPKANRILRRAEFLRVQRVGRRRSGACFVVLADPKRNGRSRLGITTSRQVGDAVVRNRVRRRVREFFRRRKDMIVPPQDIVVIAKPAAATATYADVVRELSGAFKLDVAR